MLPSSMLTDGPARLGSAQVRPLPILKERNLKLTRLAGRPAGLANTVFYRLRLLERDLLCCFLLELDGLDRERELERERDRELR